MFTMSCVQMVTANNVADNLSRAKILVAMAVDEGAQCVVLPENFAFMGAKDDDKLAHQEAYGQGLIQDACVAMAKQHGIYLVCGTLPISTDDPQKVVASSLVFNPQGECIARYDKIHLFDAAVSEQERYQESLHIQRGSECVTVALEDTGCILGLSVCYDCRFPELYRKLVSQGANVLCVPAAFTLNTGRVHWKELLTARAIENLAYVVAPNQGGTHPGGRETFGHSMIIDYWGKTQSRLTVGEGVCTASFDFKAQHIKREQFPALAHRLLG